MMALTGNQLHTPLVFITFNRPDKAQLVFEQIRQQRPEILFVISDGPREGNLRDAQLVAQSRKITENIEWPCNVTRLYSEANLGCRNRIVSALDHIFTLVDDAIILEDDCLPHSDFFDFSSELLEKYASKHEIFSIGGHIWEFPNHTEGNSYFFSKYFSSWGWATWADRWQHVDSSMKTWPEVRTSSLIPDIAETPMEIVYWQKVLDMTHNAHPAFSQAWDYAVQLSMWQKGLLSVRPRVNLVQNIGMGNDATHTRVDSPAISDRQSSAIQWPLTHPGTIERDRIADQQVNDLRVGGSLKKLLSDRS